MSTRILRVIELYDETKKILALEEVEDKQIKKKITIPEKFFKLLSKETYFTIIEGKKIELLDSKMYICTDVDYVANNIYAENLKTGGRTKIDLTKEKMEHAKKGVYFDIVTVNGKNRILFRDKENRTTEKNGDITKKVFVRENNKNKKLDYNSPYKNIEPFPYAYNFVSLGAPTNINRKPYEKGEFSGKLICTLENLTPIFTASQEKNKENRHTKENFLKNEKNKCIIPASTLKGEVRNIIEVLTTSCLRGVNFESLEENYKNDVVDQTFSPCSSIKKLCFACRMFGFAGNNNEKSQDSKEKTAGIGKVEFTDAEIVGNSNTIDITLKNLGEPRLENEKYYLTADRKLRGRKFYWHHKDKISAKTNYAKYIQTIKDTKQTPSNSSIKFIKPLNKFKFQVVFKNLTGEELGMLIYGLELENGKLHKIGKAKSFGFGSSKIKIDEFLIADEKKYNSFTQAYKIGNKEEFLNMIRDYTESKNLEIQELKYILSADNSLDFTKSPFPDRNSLTKKKNEMKNNNLKFVLPHILDYKK